MLAAIKLDRQLRLSAGKIDDEWCDDQLASEAWPKTTQPHPQ
jgi:hypothetical protein